MGDDPDTAPEGCLHLAAAGQKSVGKMLRQMITGGGSTRLQIQVLRQSVSPLKAGKIHFQNEIKFLRRNFLGVKVQITL